MDVIRGVRLLEVKLLKGGLDDNGDLGDLAAFEQPANLPFPLHSVSYVDACGPGICQEGRAAAAHFLVTAVRGAVTVDVDNGEDDASVPLYTRNRGVWTQPGVAVRFRDFGPDTVLLICASAPCGETLYLPLPQPDLIELPA